ncbi:MAG: isochorismatase family protein [Bacteroidota bacterium]
MKALVLIGLQVDYFSFGAAEITGAEDILPTINKWLPKFEHVIAARFSHPPEHKMFVANYPWRRPGQEIDLLGDKVLLKNYQCIQGSFGAELASGFDHQKITHTVLLGTEKKWLSNSAFYDEKKQRDTGLKDYLTAHHIDEIYLAGLPFEEGILQTAIEGADEGYNIKLLQNAILGIDQEEVAAGKKLLAKKGIGWLVD